MSDGNRILLICDEENISRFLREQLIVEGGYSDVSESGANDGLLILQQNEFDLVIVKVKEAQEARELIKAAKKKDSEIILIVFIDQYSQEVEELFKLGIYDCITKPVNSEKLAFLVKKGFELRSLTIANKRFIHGLKERNVNLEKQNILLAKRIEDSAKSLTRLYEDLRTTYMRTIKALAQAIEARDHYTRSHSENVARFAVAIANEMKLSVKQVETIREACELHDLGKIGIEDSILSKPSSLTNEEWEQMKRHPEIGAQILEPLTFLNDVIELVRQHHEHYDGTGYPQGRRGEDILLGARIINLADAYEAMRSARSYRKDPLTQLEATEEIKRNSGTQFEPKVVEAFLNVVNKL